MPAAGVIMKFGGPQTTTPRTVPVSSSSAPWFPGWYPVPARSARNSEGTKANEVTRDVEHGRIGQHVGALPQ